MELTNNDLGFGYFENDDFFSEPKDNQSEIVPNKDGVIFLVHLTPDIIVPSKGEDGKMKTPLEIILESITCFMKSKIISSARDKIAIVFFGAQTNNPWGFQAIDVWQEFELYSAQMIVRVKEYAQEFEKSEPIFSEKWQLGEALWACDHIF